MEQYKSTAKPAYKVAGIFFVAGRFRSVQVLEVWILGAVEFFR